MKPSKTSPDYALFRLRPLSTGRFEVLDHSAQKLYGAYGSWAKALEDLLEDVPIEENITFQWEDSDCISFVPMSLRDWFEGTTAARSVAKNNIEADMARLEKLSRSYHSGWAE